jgi:uncharacterized membrane protein
MMLMTNKKLIVLMILFSTMGILLSLYMWYVHTTASIVLCTTTCGSVITGEYGVMLGLPWGVWGLIYYLLVTILLFLRVKNVKLGTEFCLIPKLKDFRNNLLFDIDNLMLVAIIGGWLVSIYLRYLEFFVIFESCFYCWISVVIIVLITIVEFRYRKTSKV